MAGLLPSYSEFAYLSARRGLPDASSETQFNGSARTNMYESQARSQFFEERVLKVKGGAKRRRKF